MISPLRTGIEPARLTIDGVPYIAHIATIKSFLLQIEDHGLQLGMELTGNFGGVNFGAWSLDESNGRPDSDRPERPWTHDQDRAAGRWAGEFVLGVVDVIGRTDKAIGKSILALFEVTTDGSTLGRLIQGIASLDGTKFFLPRVLGEDPIIATGPSSR